VELTARSTHPPAPKAGLLLLRETILKNASYDLYMASVRPSGRTGELTSPVNSGIPCGFAVLMPTSKVFFSFSTPQTGNMPDRIGGFAAFTSLRKE